ncbi:Hypothetical_protein [Hexamita inflata]|uniref:Hypothetical_protein n=1 Tax=Hexamita inflata TaxID=28002 RepID=A0AA86R5R4_9EUKA|nr:Hypothetical protein HINF_LOCUS54112 [Hexamita inflata]
MSHSVIEYRANRNFVAMRQIPQVLPSPSKSQSSLSSYSQQSIHLINTPSKIYQQMNSECSMNLSVEKKIYGVIDSPAAILILKLTETNQQLQQFYNSIKQLVNTQEIISANISKIEVHIEKLRRYILKKLAK